MAIKYNSTLSKQELQLSGVYLLTNTLNNKVYVGSAVKFHARFNEHIRDLTNKEHANRIIQQSWEKHGPTVWLFSALEFVSDLDILLDREEEWIGKYFDDQINCYNLCRKARSNLGIKRSEETKKKQSIASLGKKKSPEHVASCREANRFKMKPIYQFTLKGEFIKKFESKVAAAKQMNCSKQVIHTATIGKNNTKTSNGFIWSKHSYETPEGKQWIDSVVISIKEKVELNEKKIVQWTMNGKTQLNMFENAEEAGRTLNIDKHAILTICQKKNKLKSIQNSLWSFENEQPRLYKTEEEISKSHSFPHVPHTEEAKRKVSETKLKQSGKLDFQVQQICMETKQVLKIFNSCKEASDITSLSASAIRNCLAGRSKTAGGFIWKYTKKEPETSIV